MIIAAIISFYMVYNDEMRIDEKKQMVLPA